MPKRKKEESIDFWLPRSGPMPRPESIEQAVEVMRREAFPAPNVSRVQLHATEFTTLCPRSGQPDFGEVLVEYVPHELCIESKSFKFYLWAFRDYPTFAEGLAERIADDLQSVLQAKHLRVIIKQYPRGAIEIEVEAERTG
jgi:7-cyano-7-deazaguanine reductase